MNRKPNLQVSNLAVSKEQTYFTLILIVAILVWLLLLVSFLVVWAAFIGIALWFGSGLLAARLRAEAVEVTESQFPELHQSFRSVCERLNLNEMPRLYVMEAGGLLNAFTMRFSGRNFVVIYADLIEAFGPESDEVKFVIGHEIGHIQRSHILKSIFLGPGMIIPLLGAAYSRACETSCDRYGAYACDNVDGSINAMLALAGGKEAPKFFNSSAFANQHHEERGFFVSLHELTSGYPTLSQRVSQLDALAEGSQAFRQAGRNILAYPFALFSVGSRASGGANILIFVVIIGLLAAMAIPAFQKVRETSQATACMNNMRQLALAYEQFKLTEGQDPVDFAQLIGPGLYLETQPVCLWGGEYNIVTDANGYPVGTCTAHGTVETALDAVRPDVGTAGY